MADKFSGLCKRYAWQLAFILHKLSNFSNQAQFLSVTLETRILRGDQIEEFKILKGYEHIDRTFVSVKEGRRTRGHGRLDIRKFSFSQRTEKEWNRLSADCVGASSVNIF